MQARLVAVSGDAHARQYDLTLPTIIGRSRRTDLTIGHPLISRQHCEVFEANGMLMVRDLGSLNGTFVGELRIAEQAMPVRPGDLISIGPLKFRAEYHSEEAQRQIVAWDASAQTMEAPLPAVDSLDKTPLPRSQHKPEQN